MSPRNAPSLQKLSTVMEGILATALIVAVLLNFGNVLGRYLFGFAFIAADEIQVYLMAAAAFLGAASVTLHHMHLRMDVISRQFPKRVRIALSITELLLIVGLCSLVAYESFRYVSKLYSMNALSENAHIPMWIPQSSVTIGFSLMALAGLHLIYRVIREQSIDFLEKKDLEADVEQAAGFDSANDFDK